MSGHPSYRVLLRLAHMVLDAVDRNQLDRLDVVETLKSRAAAARIHYDSAVVYQALNSAQYQRETCREVQLRRPDRKAIEPAESPGAADRSKQSLTEVERRWKLLNPLKADNLRKESGPFRRC